VIDKPAKMYYLLRKGIKRDNLVISIFLLTIITSSLAITITLNHFTMQFAYDQASQKKSTNTNSLDVQNIPGEKAHVGDIDIAYKVFGKGEPFLLISGSGLVMDAWDPSILRNLASNYTVIISWSWKYNCWH
jgi:hypothetical protein